MSNIAEEIANFSIKTLKSEVDLSERDWDHPYSNQRMVSDQNSEAEAFKRRLRTMNLDESQCSADLKERMLQELQHNAQSLKALGMLFGIALISRDPDVISDEQITKALSWGPYTEHYFDLDTHYSMRKEIDARGGLEAYAKQEMLRGVRQGLHTTVKEANDYDQHLKQLMSICFSGTGTMDTKLLHWFINRAEERQVAVMDNAMINYSHSGHFLVRGDHYKHPLLGSDKKHLSDSGKGSGMHTSALVAYWPEFRMARTVNRFYLFPNGAHIPEHLEPIVSKMDNSKLFDTLRDYELNLPKLKGIEEHNFRRDLTEQIKEEVAHVLAPADDATA